jgi:hypothetical protein
MFKRVLPIERISITKNIHLFDGANSTAGNTKADVSSPPPPLPLEGKFIAFDPIWFEKLPSRFHEDEASRVRLCHSLLLSVAWCVRIQARASVCALILCHQ